MSGAETAASRSRPETARAWARQSNITDPGRHTALFDAFLPDCDALRADPGSAAADDGPSGTGADSLAARVDAVCGSVRGLVSHYVASRIPFAPARRAEADSRWVEVMVSTIVGRDDAPLSEPREPAERLVGCCRDFTALAVAALRHRGIPARSRVGFADYFGDPFWYDHVVVEYFVRNYVLLELAHLAGVETLLWDTWGAMLTRPLRRDDDHTLVDRVAEVLLDRDVSRESLEALLGEPGLDPRGGVTISISPSGAFQQPASLIR